MLRRFVKHSRCTLHRSDLRNIRLYATLRRNSLNSFCNARKDVLYDLRKWPDINWRGLNWLVARAVLDKTGLQLSGRHHTEFIGQFNSLLFKPSVGPGDIDLAMPDRDSGIPVRAHLSEEPV